ncbi:MAG TPA: hypothetical protein VF725_15340 [Ktedonobacterales bacterium]
MQEISFNLPLILEIEGACRGSSETLDTEAKHLNTQLGKLEEAIRGVPNLAMAEKFEEVQQLLTRLSTSMEEAQTYLTRVRMQAEDFAEKLQQLGG